MFRGSFDHTLDIKGRVALPARWRDALLANYGSDLYLTTLGGNQLRIYPLKVWQELEDRLGARPRLDEDVEDLMLLASCYGVEGGVDRQGRILIPPRLRDRAGLDKDVTLLGKGEARCIELWNRTRLAERLARAEGRFADIKRNLAALGI